MKRGYLGRASGAASLVALFAAACGSPTTIPSVGTGKALPGDGTPAAGQYLLGDPQTAYGGLYRSPDCAPYTAYWAPGPDNNSVVVHVTNVDGPTTAIAYVSSMAIATYHGERDARIAEGANATTITVPTVPPDTVQYVLLRVTSNRHGAGGVCSVTR